MVKAQLDAHAKIGQQIPKSQGKKKYKNDNLHVKLQILNENGFMHNLEYDLHNNLPNNETRVLGLTFKALLENIK